MTIKFPETDLIACRFPEMTGRNGELAVNNKSKEYIYRLLPGMSRPKVGDMCVVSCSTGFQVAVVSSLDETVPSGFRAESMAYVVGFVDYHFYQECLEQKKKKGLIKEQLIKLKRELDDQFALEFYAEKSPEFKELLDQYNSL